MNLSLNRLVLMVFVLAAFGFAIIFFKNQTHTLTNTPEFTDTPVIASSNTNSSTNFAKEAEARREQMLAEKEEADLIAKRKLEKENSVECQFWKQQKTETSAPKIDEKIVEFCTL